MEGVKLLQLKRNPKSRGRWAQSVFLAAPEGGRGNLPPAAFFLAISRSLFESDNLKEVGENYFEATPRFLSRRAARICTQINFPPPGSH